MVLLLCSKYIREKEKPAGVTGGLAMVLWNRVRY
jgi:hypothetical protein